MVNSVTPIPTPPIAKAKMAAPMLGVFTVDVVGVRVVLLMCLLFNEDAGFSTRCLDGTGEMGCRGHPREPRVGCRYSSGAADDVLPSIVPYGECPLHRLGR
ncbi:MAG: hypothetical protein NVS2B15_10360 [Pseudarthrobacter sp.]